MRPPATESYCTFHAICFVWIKLFCATHGPMPWHSIWHYTMSWHFPSRERSHIPPNGKFWKSLTQKVPSSRGYVSSQESILALLLANVTVGIRNDIYSGITSVIQSDTLPGIWPNTPSDILDGISADVPADILADIYSEFRFDIIWHWSLLKNFGWHYHLKMCLTKNHLIS